jgi:hypothetical protein
MKVAKFIRLLIVLAGFAALAIPGVYAQSEVNPDQFDSPNTEHFPKPNAKEAVAVVTEQVRFNGKFTLPYSLHCAGKRLLPGRYTISLRSDGKVGRATLTQKDQILEIAGVVRPPVDTHAGNIVWVECIGKARRLAGIHLEEMELVFAVDRKVEPMPDGKPRRTERLLLTRTSPQK